MTISKFDALNLTAEVMQALNLMGFTQPSPIQAEAIPVLKEGLDMIGQAQTGTGKTAAFGIPIIEKVDISKREVQAVVMCPTRELAIQVSEEFRKLAKFKPGLSIVSIYGGQPIDRQKLALQKRPQILIGTPGRMLDFLWRGTFHFNSVQTMVLDEADEMLNMGFREDIEKIFDFVPTPRQMVFFSATMPKAILDLTKQYQNNPTWVQVAPKAVEVSQISQSYVEVHQKAKPKALSHLIDEHEMKRALVFCNTKRQVDFLVEHLAMEGYMAEGLHGGKSQSQRERILGRFRKGNSNILVATDVAARGIDVKNIEAVVNYDLPEDHDNYTHRIGRTGRAGQTGIAISLVAGHQTRDFLQLQKSQNHAIAQRVLPGFEAIVPSNNNRPAGNGGGNGNRPSKGSKGPNGMKSFQPRWKKSKPAGGSKPKAKQA